jgi:hypothetical protein
MHHLVFYQCNEPHPQFIRELPRKILSSTIEAKPRDSRGFAETYPDKYRILSGKNDCFMKNPDRPAYKCSEEEIHPALVARSSTHPTRADRTIVNKVLYKTQSSCYIN